MINNTLPDKKYSMKDLLAGGEEAYLKYSKAFGEGSRKALSAVLIPDTPLYDSIDNMIWRVSSGRLGSVVSSNPKPTILLLTSFTTVF